MQAKALKNTLAVTLEHVMAKHLATNSVMLRGVQTNGDTLSSVKPYALANLKDDTVAVAKAHTL